MSKGQKLTSEELFRDHLGNTDLKGKRKWIYPKIIKGPFYKYRTWLSWLLLALLFAGPHLRWQGHPVFLFNILERKFILFGVIFWPQDFHILVLGFLSLVVFIILFTVIYGRLFCGWVCPQTIFMEMVFRKIENLIEGNAGQQQKLDAMPWNTEKIMKKGTKHTIFFGISFLIANTFLAYIIGADALWKIQTDNPLNHLGGLFAILAFTAAFYLVFAKMRELVCIWACPYGRLQGVLIDRQTVVVAYDNVRGEPRGKLKKGALLQPDQGDCVDCGLCVDVCPTGIDIRNGTQLECVNCTACIDACDTVMDKINKPRGLIRYDSLDGIMHGKPLKFTPRMGFYTIILTVLVGVFVTLLVTRNNIETTILRTPGVMYQETKDGRISNLYNIEIINKTNKELNLNLKLKDLSTAQIVPVGDNRIKAAGDFLTKSAFFIYLPAGEIKRNKTEITVLVMEGENVLEEIKTSFLGPVNFDEN